jgi:hypothetical protein
VNGYRLNDQGMVLPYRMQTDSRLYEASYSMGTVGSFPEVKRTEREIGHTPPPSTHFKNP